MKPRPNSATICGQIGTKYNQVCIRPAGHLIDQHHSATGKYWWYSHGWTAADGTEHLSDRDYFGRMSLYEIVEYETLRHGI